MGRTTWPGCASCKRPPRSPFSGTAPRRWAAGTGSGSARVAGVLGETAGLDGRAFPPAERDLPLQESFAPLGLREPTSPYLDERTDVAATLTAAAERAEAPLAEAEHSAGGAAENGWRVALHVTDYNVDFFEVGTIDSPEWKIADRDTAHMTRAVVAMGGLWGNHGYEAAYALNYQDSEGQQLTGDHAYTLTLAPPPPAEAFWSLTMYDVPNYYLVDNPIDRYSIGDRTSGLVTGPDGSATEPPTDPAAAAGRCTRRGRCGRASPRSSSPSASGVES
jgi:hypothetical protein